MVDVDGCELGCVDVEGWEEMDGADVSRQLYFFLFLHFLPFLSKRLRSWSWSSSLSSNSAATRSGTPFLFKFSTWPFLDECLFDIGDRLVLGVVPATSTAATATRFRYVNR